MKTKITKDEFYKLKGILLIAQDAGKQVEMCEKIYIEMINYPQKYGADTGHFGDGVWSGDSLEEILKKEGIIIKK